MDAMVEVPLPSLMMKWRVVRLDQRNQGAGSVAGTNSRYARSRSSLPLCKWGWAFVSEL